MSPGLPFSKETFSSNHELDPASRLLPASSQTSQYLLIRPTEDIPSFLKKDLCVDRLNHIHQYLWLAGQPMPPKPLNYQLATSREIVVDQRIDMHLVWERPQSLHIKPLPRYLLDTDFWATNLITCDGPCCAPAQSNHVAPDRATKCTKDIHKCALGLLYSYIALIRFECDLTIAQNHHLLPKDMTWEKWLRFVHQLLDNGVTNPSNINPRYLYGELRLSQLNKIYAFRYGSPLRGYQFTYQTYGELFRDYLGPLTAATIYIALVLTAMQVGLATSRLGENTSFQNASWGFTVFAILGPLIGVLLAGVVGIFQFCTNLVVTKRLAQRQFALYEDQKPQNQVP
ncbi:uncharacterized protein N7496_006180 [Penicillium cataractarum]|uniref:Uncharacterized protein n=1 Tax=Penicillium cataractarum TaxID=2100454 RepID=A0A9W9V5W9_9EURO|nr:uncharacterized protein N7496_006180 [Penicillium cataractarum]KAJ5370088.1 hypothetical protein N7496_006180 [Penicillium cataractarum]